MEQLLSEIGAKELSEWMAHDRINPPPDSHFQTGLIVASLANLLGNGRRHFTPTDFMPDRSRRKQRDPEQSEAEGKAIMEALVRRLNTQAPGGG